MAVARDGERPLDPLAWLGAYGRAAARAFWLMGVTTTSVVVGNAGRTSRQEINVGRSTLERDALDGRLEIHAVLDDADTKVTGSERPPTARRRWSAVQSHEALAARGRPHPRRSGHVLRLQRTPASRPLRSSVARSARRPHPRECGRHVLACAPRHHDVAGGGKGRGADAHTRRAGRCSRLRPGESGGGP